MNGIGLQLYTVRDALAKDLPGTLQRIAAIGYQSVEIAGFDTVKPAEWQKHLKEANLTPTSLMFPLAAFEKQPEFVAETCALLKCQYAVMPWVPTPANPTPDFFKNIGGILGKAASQLKGIRVCYHNHAFEIKTFEGRTALEWILDGHPDLCSEFDVYWSHVGGIDPVVLMKRLGKRIALLHFKDSTPKGVFAPVGTGVLDWTAIRNAVSATDAGWAFVEQDECESDVFDCITQSFQFLKK